METPSSPAQPRPTPSASAAGFAPTQPGPLDGAAGPDASPDAADVQRLAQWHELIDRLQELNTRLEYLRLMLRLGVGRF